MENSEGRGRAPGPPTVAKLRGSRRAVCRVAGFRDDGTDRRSHAVARRSTRRHAERANEASESKGPWGAASTLTLRAGPRWTPSRRPGGSGRCRTRPWILLECQGRHLLECQGRQSARVPGPTFWHFSPGVLGVAPLRTCRARSSAIREGSAHRPRRCSEPRVAPSFGSPASATTDRLSTRRGTEARTQSRKDTCPEMTKRRSSPMMMKADTY